MVWYGGFKDPKKDKRQIKTQNPEKVKTLMAGLVDWRMDRWIDGGMDGWRDGWVVLSSTTLLSLLLRLPVRLSTVPPCPGVPLLGEVTPIFASLSRLPTRNLPPPPTGHHSPLTTPFRPDSSDSHHSPLFLPTCHAPSGRSGLFHFSAGGCLQAPCPLSSSPSTSCTKKKNRCRAWHGRI